ncbi:MAG: IS1634 family transposase [Acidobacteriota bacterium]
MYLRKVSRQNTDGSTVSYLQIAENIWDKEKRRSRVRVVCTLGRADERAIDRLRQLVRSIRRQSPEYGVAMEEGWKFENSWEQGAFYVVGKLWESLEIGKIIERAARAEERATPFERAVFSMVANRCLAPRSKLGCYERWMREDVYFPEGRTISLHHLYRAMDFLADHKREIEEALYWRLADLLSMDVDLIFYDTTSIHFEVEREDEELRRRGYSKEKRSDSPQVVVGMAVTRDGYPVKSWVFPGNRTDVTTIEEVKKDLRGWRLNRCIFVTDAGMVSEENLATLRRGGGRYIVAMPCRKGTEVVSDVLSHPGRYEAVQDNLEVKEVRISDRRYVVCYNPLEAERQKKHREEVLEELREELRRLRSHPKRACQLFSSHRYGPYLRQLKTGALRLNKKAIREKEKRDGLWVIHTNEEELSAEDLALAYKQLVRVEETWKTMKSTIEIRPVFHRTEERIKAHVFLCVLALLVERVAERSCESTWPRIREELRSIKIAQLLTPKGTIYQTSSGSAEARNILKKLNIEPLPEVLKVE